MRHAEMKRAAVDAVGGDPDPTHLLALSDALLNEVLGVVSADAEEWATRLGFHEELALLRALHRERVLRSSRERDRDV